MIESPLQQTIHKQIVRNIDKIEKWFREVRTVVDVPFYSSYDIRDFGHKVTNVDGNIYPAGFNNICPTDQENCGEIIKDYISRHYGAKAHKLLLLTEEHTNNAYYWDNVATLKKLIEEAGLQIEVAIPRIQAQPQTPFVMKSASRGDVAVHTAAIANGRVVIAGYEPDVVISNNDFSESYEEWGKIDSFMNPPRELGWYQRKKSNYFKHYNALATEFANLI
jgi:glutamate--cysteine ligase